MTKPADSPPPAPERFRSYLRMLAELQLGHGAVGRRSIRRTSCNRPCSTPTGIGPVPGPDGGRDGGLASSAPGLQPG